MPETERHQVQNIRPVRNMFQRYGCTTDSLQSVYSEYTEEQGVKRVIVVFGDHDEAYQAYEKFGGYTEEPYRMQVSIKRGEEGYEIAITQKANGKNKGS